MLGYGCPYKNHPCYMNANAAWRKNYCDSDTGCERCAKRPKNYGNKEVQRQNENFVRNRSDVGLGWIIIIVVVAIFILGKIL
ncbi:MAG: hypothetical protein IJ006_00540 [Lachnospiraceae bacterium]|nr:hypothetical protein [Lachnospiraceae bacterium]